MHINANNEDRRSDKAQRCALKLYTTNYLIQADKHLGDVLSTLTNQPKSEVQMGRTIISKKCSKCGIEKDGSLFRVRSYRPGSKLFPICKKCESLGAIERYKKNREKRLAYENNRYAMGITQALTTARSIKPHSEEWKRRAFEKRKLRYKNENLQRKEYLSRPEAIAKIKERQSNPEVIARRKEYSRQYSINNRGLRNLRTQKRRLTKIKRTTNWNIELDDFVLSEAKKLVYIREKLTSRQWHIDHIEPLRSKTVSGLHNAFNVAVVPAAYNMAKGNRQIEGHWITNYQKLMHIT